MDSRRNIIMQKYEVGRLLGQGNFAKVYYARNLKTNQAVAIKCIDKEKVSRVGLTEQIKREISIMRLVRHPNVIHLLEVMACKTKIYFVMEYAKGGELFNKIAKGKLKEEIARKYFHQLINAVDYCHSRGVFHRDLKPENLLLDEFENLKVSDFGLSALIESKRQDGLLHTTCGTPAYVAPEVVSRKGYDGKSADIWSCGVILFVLVAGYLPFHENNLMEMYRKISRAEYRCPSWFSFELKKLLVRILDPDPNTRITIAKIKETAWYKKDLRDENVISENSRDKNVISENSDDSSTASTSGGMRENLNLPNLNAFDIISLSTGFDLSNLFEERESRKDLRFTSKKPALQIISKLEDLAAKLRLRVKKRDHGLFKLAGVKEGRKGVVEIDAEIYEIAPEFYLIEMKKASGDTLEYKKLVQDKIRPGLNEIVWAWQGDGELRVDQEKEEGVPQEQGMRKEQGTGKEPEV
ncbi:hypothetical protein LUZ60_011020 [Juncus effusus]|nr:hypothetical protein LUZ60_011020 [Juncus effusus]